MVVKQAMRGYGIHDRSKRDGEEKVNDCEC